MKTKTKNIIAGCIVGLLICYVVFYEYKSYLEEYGEPRQIVRDHGSVYGMIRQVCFLYIPIYHEEWQEEIQGMTNWDSMEINKKMFSYYTQLLQEDQGMKIIAESYQKACKRNPRMAGHDYFCDHWGSPVCFMHINSTEHTKLHPELQPRGNVPLVYWFVGANKINEYGYGDDSFFR